jgi:hypothetical protein
VAGSTFSSSVRQFIGKTWWTRESFYWTPQTPLKACIRFTQDGFRSPVRNLQFRNVSKQFSNVSKLSPEVIVGHPSLLASLPKRAEKDDRLLLVALSRSGGKLLAVSVSKPHDFLEELSLKVNYNPLLHPFLCPKIHHGETLC